jgi:hypothetical protein
MEISNNGYYTLCSFLPAFKKMSKEQAASTIGNMLEDKYIKLSKLSKIVRIHLGFDDLVIEIDNGVITSVNKSNYFEKIDEETT